MPIGSRIAKYWPQDYLNKPATGLRSRDDRIAGRAAPAGYFWDENGYLKKTVGNVDLGTKDTPIKFTGTKTGWVVLAPYTMADIPPRTPARQEPGPAQKCVGINLDGSFYIEDIEYYGGFKYDGGASTLSVAGVLGGMTLTIAGSGSFPTNGAAGTLKIGADAGVASSLTIIGLKYLSMAPGVVGNNVRVRHVSGGALSITRSGNDVTITFKSDGTTSTKAVQDLLDTDYSPDTPGEILTASGGSNSTFITVATAFANLAGGVDPGIEWNAFTTRVGSVLNLTTPLTRAWGVGTRVRWEPNVIINNVRENDPQVYGYDDSAEGVLDSTAHGSTDLNLNALAGFANAGKTLGALTFQTTPGEIGNSRAFSFINPLAINQNEKCYVHALTTAFGDANANLAIGSDIPNGGYQVGYEFVVRAGNNPLEKPIEIGSTVRVNLSTVAGVSTTTARQLRDLLNATTTVVTISIATPAVISQTAHGLVAGSTVVFSTTGALPTGIVAGTSYYVLASGLTANAFQISATPGGAAIATSGTQSGVHSIGQGFGGPTAGAITSKAVTFLAVGSNGTGIVPAMPMTHCRMGEMIVSLKTDGAGAITSTAFSIRDTINDFGKATDYFLVSAGSNPAIAETAKTLLVGGSGGTLYLRNINKPFPRPVDFGKARLFVRVGKWGASYTDYLSDAPGGGPRLVGVSPYLNSIVPTGTTQLITDGDPVKPIFDLNEITTNLSIQAVDTSACKLIIQDFHTRYSAAEPVCGLSGDNHDIKNMFIDCSMADATKWGSTGGTTGIRFGRLGFGVTIMAHPGMQHGLNATYHFDVNQPSYANDILLTDVYVTVARHAVQYANMSGASDWPASSLRNIIWNRCIFDCSNDGPFPTVVLDFRGAKGANIPVDGCGAIDCAFNYTNTYGSDSGGINYNQTHINDVNINNRYDTGALIPGAIDVNIDAGTVLFQLTPSGTEVISNLTDAGTVALKLTPSGTDVQEIAPIAPTTGPPPFRFKQLGGGASFRGGFAFRGITPIPPPPPPPPPPVIPPIILPGPPPLLKLLSVVHLKHDGSALGDCYPNNPAFALYLGKVGYLTYDLDSSHPLANRENVEAYATDYELYFGKRKIQAGFHTDIQVSQVEGHTINISGKDWLHWFEGQIWPFDPAHPLAYVYSAFQKDVFTIVEEWLTVVQAQDFEIESNTIQFTFNNGLSGVLANAKIDAGDNESMLNKLTSLSQASPGFDFEVTPDRAVRLFYPRKTRVSPLVLEQGSNIYDFTYHDKGPIATRTVGTAQGPSSKLAVIANHVNQAKYRLWSANDDFNDVTDIESLTARTLGASDRNATPHVEFTVKVIPDFIQDLFEVVEIGDTMSVYGDIGYDVIDDQFRLVSIVASPNDEGDQEYELGFDDGTISL